MKLSLKIPLAFATALSLIFLGALYGEISSAFEEQHTGIAQINVAVNQMDEVTQRNAGLGRGTVHGRAGSSVV
jgi:methyl-accepting chemotaxis protein